MPIYVSNVTFTCLAEMYMVTSRMLYVHLSFFRIRQSTRRVEQPLDNLCSTIRQDSSVKLYLNQLPLIFRNKALDLSIGIKKKHQLVEMNRGPKCNKSTIGFYNCGSKNYLQERKKNSYVLKLFIFDFYVLVGFSGYSL